MNLTSYLVNKCVEYLLDNDSELFPSSRSTSTASCSILPPWARDPQLFKSRCNGCGICLASCKNSILVADSEGYPHIDFSAGSCSFCGACAESCPQDAFCYEPLSPPWNLKAWISESCLARNKVLCRTCEEHCEHDAIVVPKKYGTICPPHVISDKCTGCGACFSSCPVRALFISDTAESEKS